MKPSTSVSKSLPDNTSVDTSLHRKSLYVWDAATGKERWNKHVPFLFPSDIALSPDGKIVAVGGLDKGLIHLWSVETGKELRTIATQHHVYSLAFSPDGSTLFTGGLLGAVRLWEPSTGKLLRQRDSKSRWISRLALTRDGRTLVTAGHVDGSLRLCEVATGHERAHFQWPGGSVRARAISRDGRQIASGYEDTTILVWDATAGARSDVALSARGSGGVALL
jgi:WD40 repeat protein